MKKILKISKSQWMFIILLIFFLSKLLKITYLGDKYFSDAELLLKIMNGSVIVSNYWNNYGFAATFFNFLNIFHINDIYIFEWLLGTVFSFQYYGMIKRKTKVSVLEFSIICLACFFLNIYVFSLSKDIIQYVLLLIFLKVVLRKKRKVFLKFDIVPFIPLLIVTFFLRSYFIVIIAFYILFILYDIRSFTTKKMLAYTGCSIAMFLFALFTLQSVNMSLYSRVINVTQENSYAYANTLIVNILPNINFAFYAINYLTKCIRLLLPFELLTKGVLYYVFLFYHFGLLKLLKIKDNIPNGIKSLYFFIISFFLVAVVFEPDFGSFLRHQSTLIPIYLCIISGEKKYEKRGSNNKLQKLRGNH